MMHEVIEIDISLDGDAWCALIGENLQEGVAGFGYSPIEALENLCGELRLSPYNFETFTLG